MVYLVYMVGGPWNHVDLWEIPRCRRWYERLAQRRTLVAYDFRGTGLSEHEVTDFSLEARLLDLEALLGGISQLTGFELELTITPHWQASEPATG